MSTFFGRRYARKIEAVGYVERAVGALILILTAGIVAAYIGPVATNRDRLFDVDEASTVEATADIPVESGPKEPFPDVGLAGWQAPRLTERFTADTLYAKIDGQADAYVRLGVVGLVFGAYAAQADAERTIDVYWYNMGNAASAQRMYQSEAPPDATALALGGGSYQAGGAVFFWKGASYVQVLPSRPDEVDARAALSIAQSLAERIQE